MIPVTKPFLPLQEEYNRYVSQIWQRNWLTNNGPLVNELELKMKSFLGVDHLLFTCNGTIAIQMAIKAFDLQGEIITTPFSYVATSSTIVWENCVPVYADIDPHRWTIDPEKIEALITPQTCAILATHVYGIPCHIEEIEAIAQKHRLVVIYDAAHAFGTTYKGKSLLGFGDISTLSTHATKLFHTIEGGAVISREPDVLKKLAYLRNFGHNGPESFIGVGINGKNSEFHAAMGLVNLSYVNDILAKRQRDSLHYDDWLLPNGVQRPLIPANTQYNHSYYPVLFPSHDVAMKVFHVLANHEVFARRYFYPSLSSLPYVDGQPTPVCDDVASKVLCLPLYYDLSEQEIDLICRLIIRTLKY